jgi:hypothetical protein
MDFETPDEDELRQAMDEDGKVPLLLCPGKDKNCLLSIMPDPYSGGWFAVRWQFPPGEDAPIGTIRPFPTLKDASDWLAFADTW